MLFGPHRIFCARRFYRAVEAHAREKKIMTDAEYEMRKYRMWKLYKVEKLLTAVETYAWIKYRQV